MEHTPNYWTEATVKDLTHMGVHIRLKLEDRKEGKVIAALAKGYPKLTAKIVIEMDDHVSLASLKAELEAV